MNKYYAVIKGRKPGVYETWGGLDGAQRQVAGYIGGLFLSFPTLEEAQAWYKEKAQNSGLPAFLPKQQRNQIKHSRRIKAYQEGGRTIIYLSTSKTQQVGKCGWGVFVDHPGEPKSYSGSINSVKSYKFDLIATKKALQYASEYEGTVITMNFNMVAKAFDKGWPFDWRINNWKNSKGRPPEEVEFWKEILNLYEIVEPVLLVKPPYVELAGHKKASSLALRERKSIGANQPKCRKPKWKPRRKKNKMKKSSNIYSSNPKRSYTV
jgi:ribonuclease HI